MTDTPQFRVIFSVHASGKHFRVDEQSDFYGRYRWKHADRFRSLAHALAKYPGAEASELSEKQQRHLEQTPHVFDDRFDSTGKCGVCGQTLGYADAVHRAGGAA